MTGVTIPGCPSGVAEVRPPPGLPWDVAGLMLLLMQGRLLQGLAGQGVRVDILDAFCQINKRWFESVSYDDWAV